MSERGNTKRKILKLGQQLLQEKGFNAFSYKHISSALGIQNAAIHYHYPTKEDLGLAIIRDERERFQRWIRKSQIQEMDVWGKLDWFFSIYIYFLESDRICVSGAMSTDFGTLPEKMRQESTLLLSEMLEWLEGVLANGREQNEFFFLGEASDRAATILAGVQGALQIARLTSAERFHKTVSQIRDDLKVHQ